MQATTTAPPPLVIYTDGSSRGNPGPGGYGVVMLFGGKRKEMSQGYRLTTNNRMELLAVIEALKALKRHDMPIHVYTDSKYVCEAVTKGWLAKWLRTSFAGGKKNSDLWIEYARVAKPLTVQFHWVKGHADNPHNNRCDQLATEAADRGPHLVDFGYEQQNLAK